MDYNINSKTNNNNHLLFVIISVFFITGCLTMGYSPNSNPPPSILTNNFDKTVDLSTQALVHIQKGLKIVECDNQSTVDDLSGEAWGTESFTQFVAVLSPGHHRFKIELAATFYSNGTYYSYSARDILLSYDFIAGHLYSIMYQTVDGNTSGDKRLNIITGNTSSRLLKKLSICSCSYPVFLKNRIRQMRSLPYRISDLYF
jgi:hypothetical protein